MTAVTTQWSREDIKKLLVELRKNIPADKISSRYSIGMEAIDWNTVAFYPFTPKDCLNQWKSIMSTVRKTRSLTEIIDVAATHTLKKKPRFRKEDDKPCRPPSNGFILFCNERQKSLPANSKSRKAQTNLKIWEELTEEQRNEYGNRCIELWRKYKVSQSARALQTKRGVNKNEPTMPTRTSYSAFFQEQLKLQKGKPSDRQALFKEICKKWMDLPDAEKKAYEKEAQQRMREYSEELQTWFRKLSRAQQRIFLQRNPKKKQYLVAKETPVSDKEDPLRNRALDLDDEDIESSSSSDEFFYSEVEELEGDGQGDAFEVF